MLLRRSVTASPRSDFLALFSSAVMFCGLTVSYERSDEPLSIWPISLILAVRPFSNRDPVIKTAYCSSTFVAASS